VKNSNHPKTEDIEEDESYLCQGSKKHVHYYSRLHNKIVIRTQRIQVSFSLSLKYLCRSTFAKRSRRMFHPWGHSPQTQINTVLCKEVPVYEAKYSSIASAFLKR